MSRGPNIPPGSEGRRYEAVLCLSEALSLCAEPEDLTKILSEQLREFLAFLQFYIIIYKENSTEVEWAVVGREQSLVAAYADVPVEQRPSWQAYTTQEPFHIHDWTTDERVPIRLKLGVAAQGLDVGPLVFVPLTTPHRRLGALGMSGPLGTVYNSDDVSFLRLIGRVVAFAIDDNFNLRRAEVVQRELQRQNERLQRSERELREVIESIPSMAWSAGVDGAAEFFNGRWLAYAGLTAEQAQGWGWTVAVHPDDLYVLVDYWRTLVASGQSGEIEGRLRRFDGVYRWFLFRATPSIDDGGRVVKWYGTNTDIEERKRVEQALKRSEAYLAEAQRLTHTGSCAIDGSSRETLYWSEEMFRLFDFDPQQGLPMWDQWLQRIHPEDREKVKLAGDRTFLQKVDCDVEFRIVKPDGTLKQIHGIGHPVLSPNGALVQVIGTMVDITERKRADETLREQANLLNLTNDAIFVRDENLIITYWNRGAEKLYGWTQEEAEGQISVELLKTRFPVPLEQIKAELLSNGRWEGELVRTKKAGTQVVVATRWSLQRDDKGGQGTILETNNDITERKRAEEERERLRQELAHLARLNRVSTIGELTASLTHEINQPIGAAMTNAQACLRFLNRGQPDVPEAREAALEMVRDATRAADIIDRVRSLYRKGSSKLEMVDVNEVIEEMVVMLHDEANRSSVNVRTELCVNLPDVLADHVQLQQVLMNLMINGIEAMRDAGGELSIKSQLAEDGQLAISVSDMGVGLPSGKANEIFNAFFTTKPQGTGLGLAITRSIVESHGGRLWASANSGRGATFQFTLPQKTAAPA
jgi:PAS domain S-box-containing protein